MLIKPDQVQITTNLFTYFMEYNVKRGSDYNRYNPIN